MLDTAMAMVDAEGVDSLTVRGLAAKLGVAGTAIYWHVGDKQAVLDGLVERVIAQMGEVVVSGRGSEARILSIGRSLRHSLLERPDLVALVNRQGRAAALFQPARRVLVRELTAAGLHGEDAALAVHTILNMVVGSVLVDRQVERQPEQHQTTEELWTEEDVSDAPDLLAYLLRPYDDAELFEYALRVLVRALIAN